MTPEERIDYINKAEWTGKGWYGLIVMTNALLSEIYPDYDIDQIKEKFGGLRYYVSCDTSLQLQDPEKYDRFFAIVRKCQAISYLICEKCGAKGELRKELWHKTLCNECYADKENL